MKLESINFVAGLTAGASTTLILHPLDLIKTRLHISKSPSSTRKVFQDIWRRESFRGLYSGLSANVLGAASSWGIYFYLYTLFKPENSSYHENLLAAAKAGSITSLITNPIWLIKTRMCTQPQLSRKYRNVFHAVGVIVREEGVLGLYKGLIPALFGVSHGAIQFMIYEELKRLRSNNHSYDIKRRSGAEEENAFQSWRFIEYVGMAATSKTIATVSTYPYQTIKSRLQSHLLQYNGIMHVMSDTYRNEGIRGFYRGLGTNLIRVLPGTMCTFLIYELMMFQLKKRFYYSTKK